MMQSQQQVNKEDDDGPPPGWQPIPTPQRPRPPPPPPVPSGQLLFIHSLFLSLLFFSQAISFNIWVQLFLKGEQKLWKKGVWIQFCIS